MVHRALVQWLLVCVLLAAPWAGRAADAPDALRTLGDGGEYEVAGIVDGDTIILDDGREVRLVGIQAPKLPLGREDFKAWPLGYEAKTRVQSLVGGRMVRLHLGAQPVDRHGRVLAHVIRSADGLWLQGTLLEEGLARVYTFPDNRLMADEMLALERGARDAGAGVWALPYYAIRTPDTVRFDEGSYQLVEGRVLDAAQVRGRVYLNFGANWRTDFTVKIEKRHVAAFEDMGLDPLSLKGQRIRVRGWVGLENGPMITLDHPERLEVLGR